MITRAKPKGFAGHVLQLRQRAFFHGQIGLEVEVCGVWALVTEPERDGREVDARLQEMHRRGVPQRMG